MEDGRGRGWQDTVLFQTHISHSISIHTLVEYMDKLVHAHVIESNMGDYRPLFRAFMDWLESNQTPFEGMPFYMHVEVLRKDVIEQYHYQYHQHEFREQRGGCRTSVHAYLSDPPNCQHAERSSYCLTLYLDGSKHL